MRVKLPNDQWAEFRDLADLKGGDAKAMRRATRFKVEDGQLSEITAGIADEQMDALLARIITSWSLFNYALPIADPSSLDEIPLDTYNALVDAAQPYKDAIDKAGKAPALTSVGASDATSSQEIVQGSVMTPSPASTAPWSGAGSPSDGGGHPQSQTSNPSSS